jgi:hypothetical protein
VFALAQSKLAAFATAGSINSEQATIKEKLRDLNMNDYSLVWKSNST